MPPCYHNGTCGHQGVVVAGPQARGTVPGGHNVPVAINQQVIGGYYPPAYYGGYPGFGPFGNAVFGGFGLGLGYGFIDSFGHHHGGHHGGNNDSNSHNNTVDSHDTTNNYYDGDGSAVENGDTGGDSDGGDGGDAGGGDGGGE